MAHKKKKKKNRDKTWKLDFISNVLSKSLTMYIRGKMRLQSVLVLESPSAKDAVEFRFLSAKAEMRIHGRFSRVDLAAHSARIYSFPSGQLTWNTNDESCVDAEGKVFRVYGPDQTIHPITLIGRDAYLIP